MVFTKKTHTLLIGLVVTGLVSGCATIKPQDETRSLVKWFDFQVGDGWIVPKRPNAIWSVGQIVQIHNEYSYLQPLGSTVSDLDGCISAKPTRSAAPQYSSNRQFDYNISLSGTLNVPQSVLNESGIKGEHKTTVKLDSVTRNTLPIILAEKYIRENYDSGMSDSCKDALNIPSRYIIGETYEITDGEVTINNSDGTKVDLNSIESKLLKDAALEAGYTVNQNGSLVFSEPTPIALRLITFDDYLKRLGTNIDRPDFKSIYKRLDESGTIITSEKSESIWPIIGGIGTVVVVAGYLLSRDSPTLPGRAINIETSFPQ